MVLWRAQAQLCVCNILVCPRINVLGDWCVFFSYPSNGATMYALVYHERDGGFLCALSQYLNSGYRIVICIAYMDFPRVLSFSSLAQALHDNGKKTGSFLRNQAFNDKLTKLSSFRFSKQQLLLNKDRTT